jgi:hypothetical protein
MRGHVSPPLQIRGLLVLRVRSKSRCQQQSHCVQCLQHLWCAHNIFENRERLNHLWYHVQDGYHLAAWEEVRCSVNLLLHDRTIDTLVSPFCV